MLQPPDSHQAPSQPAYTPGLAPDVGIGIDRIEALTGLRAVAALLVVLSHLRAPDNAWLPIRTFFDAGYCGVTVFFILSGFVLAHNYAEPLRRDCGARSLWSYAVARLARIYPLYLVMLAWFVTPLLVAGAPVPALADHALMLQAWHPDGLVATYYNGPGWSVGVELFLYCCFPLLALAGRPLTRHPRRLLVGMVIIVSMMGAITWWFNASGLSALPRLDPRGPHRWLYRSPLLRLGDFALGMLAAEWVRAVTGQRWTRLVATLALGVGSSSMVALMCWPSHLFTAQSWDLSYAVPSVLIIIGLALAPASPAARALGAPAMVRLGDASYALYLSHWAVLGLALRAPMGVWWPATMGMTLLMLESLAMGLHLCVELPARRWLRRTLAPAASR